MKSEEQQELSKFPKRRKQLFSALHEACLTGKMVALGSDLLDIVGLRKASGREGEDFIVRGCLRRIRDSELCTSCGVNQILKREDPNISFSQEIQCPGFGKTVSAV